jgi:proteasome component ECM29
VGNEEVRDKLVTSLVEQFSGKAKPQVRVGATDAFLEESFGGATKGEVTSYRELCSLATDMGQPDVVPHPDPNPDWLGHDMGQPDHGGSFHDGAPSLEVYQFLDVANHHASWNTKRGAAFAIADHGRERLAPHLAGLIPKLYRYRYDPNGKVQDSMKRIWDAFVPNEKDRLCLPPPPRPNWMPLCPPTRRESRSTLMQS